MHLWIFVEAKLLVSGTRRVMGQSNGWVSRLVCLTRLGQHCEGLRPSSRVLKSEAPQTAEDMWRSARPRSVLSHSVQEVGQQVEGSV